MKLLELVERLHRSSERMIEAMKTNHDEPFWFFMRDEIWLHLRRTVQAWWKIIRRKEG